MSASTSTDYDRVAYPSMAHPQTFPENLSIKGHLHGLNTARPEGCRVLELGCGDGYNLFAMAAAYPESYYTGIDYAAAAVERGRAIAAELGLRHVRLEAADIRELGALQPALGEFDYIIAHGVYSWVPEDVRDAVFAVIDRWLAPDGVAFVSYVALPGGYVREAVRTMIRYHTRGIEEPREKMRRSVELLRVVASASEAPDDFTRAVGLELATIEKMRGESLYHDELSSISAPALFTDFVAQAGRHGLQFFSEAESVHPFSRSLTPEAREKLRELEGDRLRFEQYLDFVEGRRFRQSLLCRKGREMPLDPERVETLWVTLLATVEGGERDLRSSASLDFVSVRKSLFSASTAVAKAAFLELSARRGEAFAFAELREQVKRRLSTCGLAPGDGLSDELRRVLCESHLPGMVEFSWGPRLIATAIPAKPVAHPLARWAVSKGISEVNTYGEIVVELSGKVVRFLLSRLDGTRDRAALLREVTDYLAEVQPETRGARNDAAVRALIEKDLRGLTDLGLIRRC